MFLCEGLIFGNLPFSYRAKDSNGLRSILVPQTRLHIRCIGCNPALRDHEATGLFDRWPLDLLRLIFNISLYQLMRIRTQLTGIQAPGTRRTTGMVPTRISTLERRALHQPADGAVPPHRQSRLLTSLNLVSAKERQTRTGTAGSPAPVLVVAQFAYRRSLAPRYPNPARSSEDASMGGGLLDGEDSHLGGMRSSRSELVRHPTRAKHRASSNSF